MDWLMLCPYRRSARFVLPLIAAALSLSGCALFQQAGLAPRPSATASSAAPWLYRGSDVPVDPAWRFGTLPNGVRYAVRRNGVPPGQVSVRVRIDAGSLMETPEERGFAHYLEHLSFRGSAYVPDGEAKRIWQRLGATFGSDSNAQTTPTQTVYKLDLPTATRSGLDESMKILSGMISGPIIDKPTVDSERPVVLAEAREQFGPGVRISDATRALLFNGQPLADHSPIGTTETLNAATAESLRAFHDRWYRPERTVVVVAGDGDPRLFETMIRQHFSGWTGKGRKPREPDFGRPGGDAPSAAVIVEPALPAMITLATLRPWVKKDDTIAYNQRLMRDLLAVRLINRQLESRARGGGSFLQAQVDRDDVSRSADATFVSILPLGDDWQKALTDVRTVIAQAATVPPTQADIDREVEEFDAALVVGVESARSEAGGKLADDIVQAVDIRETVASAQVALDVFRSTKPQFTPEAALESTRRLFSGVATRALLTTPRPVENGEARLAATLAADLSGAALARASQAPIGFDRLPAPGTPATVVKREAIADIGTEFVELSNGVRLVLFPTNSEAGKVMVSVRFGNGTMALPADRQTPAWAGALALVESGIGDLGQEELDRLTSGRRINMALDIDDDAFEFNAVTRAADLADQLRLIAAKLGHPGWDPNPVLRARAALLAGYDSARGSPVSVLGRDLPGLLRMQDPRWTAPDRDAIAALDPAGFRALWEPLLKTGPVELLIFGDFETEAAIKAAAATLGALPRRERPAIAPGARLVRFPAHGDAPLRLTHDGPADQAAAVIAWPTGGGMADIRESYTLDVLTAIFSDRLFDQLRQAEGASYSPNVSSNWPTQMDGGGYIVAASALKPESIETFYRLTGAIAADLAARPVEPDELQRALGPITQFVARSATGNAFWLNRLSGASWDRRRVDAIDSLRDDLARITPQLVQQAAKRWLDPAKSWSAEVLPAGQPQR